MTESFKTYKRASLVSADLGSSGAGPCESSSEVLRDKMLAAKKLLIECEHGIERNAQIGVSGDA